MSKEVNCQRYFATSKRVPKDVKRHCGMCRQHGMLIETRGHHCNRKNCNCSRCFLIRQRRQIMSTQIRIRRAQDKIFQRTSELTEATIIPQNCFDKSKSATCHLRNTIKTNMITQNQCYICQKCKNHGILVWKKEHKRHCLYANCTCNQCKLIEKRRKLDQILKTSKFKFNKNKKEQQIHIPISMNSLANSNMLSVLTNIDEQLTGQTHDEKLAEIPTPQSKSSSYTVNRVLLTSRFQSSSQTNISRVTFDESQESDTMLPAALAYPIPLKPQIFPLPIATVNMPAMCSFYSSTDALLNIRAMMQFALGFQ
ncbi:Doublesex- and mab-3-related transcription factor [Dirofilaria immitis]